MKHPMKANLWSIGTALLVMVFLFTGNAAAGKPENVACEGNIQWNVAAEVQVTSFECALGEHGGEPSLIFNMAVKNVSDTDQRYRINIFLLDMDKAAGHLVPRKGKPPVVPAGEEAKVNIPFIKTTAMSKDMLVIVKTISLD